MNPLLFDFEETKKAYQHESNPPLEIRRQRIERILQLINENEENICKAISADFGQRNTVETRFAELAMIRQAANFTLKNLSRWMKEVPVKTNFLFRPSKSLLIPQSKGVVGIMSPWNYPLQLALVPAISAFAAGNRVWLKPSERSPRISGYLATLVTQYFHPTEFSVVCGGPDVAANFSSLPFDHLFFTGSTATGYRVMAAAAQNLTPVTLELGGKSPAIIDTSAKMSDAASRLTYGKLMNAGQTCVAPDYILAPHNLIEPLIEAIKKSAGKMYPNMEGLTYPIDEQQANRWSHLLNDAASKGAHIIPLFDQGSGTNYPITPSIVLNAPSDSIVMKEEIFGPILPIIGYSSIQEAIDFVLKHDHPLALYWFGKENKAMQEVLTQTHAGGVTTNDTLIHLGNENLPFGGVGPSGMGAYHGKAGFDTFTHYKSVLKTRARLGLRALSGTKLAHPPYGKKVEHLIKVFGKS